MQIANPKDSEADLPIAFPKDRALGQAWEWPIAVPKDRGIARSGSRRVLASGGLGNLAVTGAWRVRVT